MSRRLKIIAFFLISFFLVINETGFARDRNRLPDSIICCTPDSLNIISTNYPTFCVGWKVAFDSTCLAPMGFELEWKPLFGGFWISEYVPYSSGIYISHCDSVDTCGVYQWRVRTKCNDSTFSDWVYGPKITMNCGHDMALQPSKLRIFPAPASEAVTIITEITGPAIVEILIYDLNGRRFYEKPIRINKKLKLTETIPVNSWPKGTYFINLRQNGIVIRKGSFMKE